MYRYFIAALFYLLSFNSLAAESNHFYVIPLGVSGGELENNLSSYLITTVGSQDFIALDAGTLCSAIKKLPLAQNQNSEDFFKNHIKAYLISHAHLDHISGLVLCSPIDGHKPIWGIDSTINYLRDYVFNWKIWPNLANEGLHPLNQYEYHRLSFNKNYLLPQPAISVQVFPLNHGDGYPSTAFLLKSQDHYLLYFGDTGPDPVEHSQDIELIWQAVAGLIREHKLNSIFIEVSYTNDRPDKLLFGHMTPHWLLYELNQLAKLVNPEHPQNALMGLKIVVTHIKQGLEQQDIPAVILNQLNADNQSGAQFIIPQQLKPLSL